MTEEPGRWSRPDGAGGHLAPGGGAPSWNWCYRWSWWIYRRSCCAHLWDLRPWGAARRAQIGAGFSSPSWTEVNSCRSDEVWTAARPPANGSCSEAEQDGLEAKSETELWDWKVMGHSLSETGCAFSLAGQELSLGPESMMWPGTMKMTMEWQILRKYSADGWRSQPEAEVLKANF